MTPEGRIREIVRRRMAEGDDFDLKRCLQFIDAFEHSEGRLLLSASVVNERTGIPDDEFFENAERLGLFGGGDHAAKVGFWRAEIRRLDAYWGEGD